MRIPLPKGHRLTLESDSRIEIIVGDVIGEGGCCIAYKGEMQLGIPVPVVIKECYPVNLALERRNVREGDYSLCFADEDSLTGDKERFEKRKEMFRKGILRNRIVANLNETNELFGMGKANQTLYSFSLYNKGVTLTDYADGTFLSVTEIADIMIPLCRSIQKYHKAGYIYLDCKPDNVFVTHDQDGKISANVIDFDTIIPYEKRGAQKNPCTYSMGFAAPEQMDPSKSVSYKTDVFSIGAVFFWLLTGKEPYQIFDAGVDYSMLTEIQEGQFDWRTMSGICRNADQKTIDLIQEIARKSLAEKQEKREYGSLTNELEEMIGDFGYLSRLAGKNLESVNNILPTSENRFKYNSNSTVFRGRGAELGILMDMCAAQDKFRWIGISGLGGTGKTRLAYELCSRMLKQYWHVFPPMRFNEYTKGMIQAALTDRRGNLLICLDYIKQNMGDIMMFAKSIIENPYDSDYKIRLVLIEREEADIETDDYDLRKYQYTFENENGQFDGIVDLQPMEDEAIRSIIVDYIVRQDPDAAVTEDAVDLISRTLKSVDRENRRPLYALFIADAWLNEEDLRHWNRMDALDYLLGREEQRLSAVVDDPQNGLNIIEQGKYTAAIRHLFALATYLGSIDLSEYLPMLETEYRIRSDDEMLPRLLREAGMLSSDGVISGLEPDLIGEYYCIEYFNSRCRENGGTDKVQAFVNTVIEKDLSAFASYSNLIYKDYQDIICECEWIDILRNVVFPAKYNYVRSNQFRGQRFLKNIAFTGRLIEIQPGAFRECHHLERIIFPSSLERIGAYAFSGCSNLLEAIPEDGKGKNPSIIAIDNYAFQDCESLEKIIIPDSTQEIGVSAFENCKALNEIVIPRKITKLNCSVFAGCSSLKTVSLENVKRISLADSCFRGCSQLSDIRNSNRITAIGCDAFRDCVSLKSASFSHKLNTVGCNAFSGCRSLQTADLSVCGIRSIPERMFYECKSLTAVSLPGRTERIGDRCFSRCSSLTRIVLKPSVINIGRYAFSGCTQLKSVIAAGNLQEIGSYAFENCFMLSRVHFGGTPEQIGDHAFEGCDSLSYSDIEGLDYPGMARFCGFTFHSFSEAEYDFIRNYMTEENVIIPGTVCAVGDDAFRGAKDENGARWNKMLRSVTIPVSVKTIGERAFLGCKNLQTVTCGGNSIESIGAQAFSGCSALSEVKGAMHVSEIPDEAFQNCSSLKSIRFSEKVKSIGVHAFRGCQNLKNISILNQWMPRIIRTGAFEDCPVLDYPVDADRVCRLKLTPRSFTLEGFVFNRITQAELDFVREYMNSDTVSIPESCIDINSVDFSVIGGMRKLIVPDSVHSLPACAFKDCRSLEKVELPGKMTHIPANAFENCGQLKTVSFRGWQGNTVPNGTTIGSGAFFGCGSLTDLRLPEDLGEIKSHTFDGCVSLEQMDIPPNVTLIGNAAFKNCRELRTIRFPASLTGLGKSVFSGCTALESVADMDRTGVTVIQNNTFEFCSHLETLALPRTLKRIRGHAFEECSRLTVPRGFLPNSLEVIEDAAFQGCSSIECIRIPKGIKEIGSYTFKNCGSLKEISLPDHIRHIGQSAFYCCSSLSSEEFELPADLESLGISAFAYCRSLREIRIPCGIQSFPEELFKGCRSLETVDIPEHIREIPNDCFKDCISLKKASLPDGLEIINVGAFRNCSALEMDLEGLPGSLTEIRESAFRQCDSLVRVRIPEQITKFSAAVFEGCRNLIEVEFSHHIGVIGNYAFADCTALETFPFRLVDDEIGDAAFIHCGALRSPVFSDSIKVIRSAAFRGCAGIEKISLPDSISMVCGAAFRENSSLRRVSLPETVTVIKKSAFRDCRKLTDVQIDADRIKIGHTAFKGCVKLDYIDLPPDCTVAPDAFEDCPAEEEIMENEEIRVMQGTASRESPRFLVTEDAESGNVVIKRYIGPRLGVVEVPEIINGRTVVGIGNGCFEEQYGITDIILPDSIETIGENAFAYCKSLSSVNIPAGVTSIGAYAFKDCHIITSLELPDTITEIKSGTFMFCWQLERVALPNKLRKICERAFLSCPEIRLDIPDSVSIIEAGAFAKCSPDRIRIVHMPAEKMWFD